ncbi:MAG: helix-turn-helix transcriptional regulator [Actinobacteria bacterium]|jgi:transcriptional regulator with XRE-family HTH domain|nr:helix-turn-helix transcriptional regulator [Actinomycetota bacterium]
MILLTQLRKAQGWPQVELARRAYVHPSLISQIEAGLQRLNPDSRPLLRLAEALGWTGSPERLLEEVH